MRYYHIDMHMPVRDLITLPSLFSTIPDNPSGYAQVLTAPVPLHMGMQATEGKEMREILHERAEQPTRVASNQYVLAGGVFTSCFVLVLYHIGEPDCVYARHFQISHLDTAVGEMPAFGDETWAILARPELDGSYGTVANNLVAAYGTDHVYLIDGFTNFSVTGDRKIRFC